MQRLYQVSVEELKKREAERLNIESGIEMAKKEVDDECVAIIDEFSETKEEVFERLSEMAEQLLDLDPEAITDSQINSVESLRANYRLEVRTVWDTLLGRELMLVNSIEAMIEEYEARLGNMTDGFLESAGALLQQARDTETMYFQHLLDQAEVLIESEEVPEKVLEGVPEGVSGMVTEMVPKPTEEPINTSCLENYETAKERFYVKTGGKKSNHLMLEMDDCIKSKLMEPGRCTMEKFKGIYSKCEKGIIGEIKEFIEDDEKVHEMYDFEHDKSVK